MAQREVNEITEPASVMSKRFGILWILLANRSRCKFRAFKGIKDRGKVADRGLRREEDRSEVGNEVIRAPDATKAIINIVIASLVPIYHGLHFQ